jgi:hypothetical protein
MKSFQYSSLYKRILFCLLFSLGSGAIITVNTSLFIVSAAVVVHLQIIGLLIALSGIVVWPSSIHRNVLPLIRGALVASVLHLDFVIAIWSDQTSFWQAVVFAAVYGALLDFFTTRLFGQGKDLFDRHRFWNWR